MTRTLGLGIAGFGTAGRMMAEALGRSARFTFAAVADPDDGRRDEARRAGAAAAYPTLEKMLGDDTVNAIYLATPTALHLDGVQLAARAGRPIVVEKPFASSPEEGRTAVAAADSAGVPLIVGATRSFDAPIRRLREMVLGGELGALQSVTNLCASDWLARPRQPRDLDARLGGGIVYRQGGHQLDILRSVVGAAVRSVRATTFGGSDGSERGYHALLFFDNGVVASALYDGWGGFDSRLLTFGVGELGDILTLPADDPRRAFLPGIEMRSASATGGALPTFGFTLATFADADVVPALRGWLVIRPSGATEVPVDPWPSGWDAVLAELAAALDGASSPHDGRSGLATLQICAAVHESSRTGREIVVGPSLPPSGSQTAPTLEDTK